MNICMCCSQAGYPHAADCPFPCFSGSRAMEDAWELARQTKLKLVIGEAPENPPSPFDASELVPGGIDQ
jgi:hypothetical protein